MQKAIKFKMYNINFSYEEASSTFEARKDHMFLIYGCLMPVAFRGRHFSS